MKAVKPAPHLKPFGGQADPATPNYISVNAKVAEQIDRLGTGYFIERLHKYANLLGLNIQGSDSTKRGGYKDPLGSLFRRNFSMQIEQNYVHTGIDNTVLITFFDDRVIL